MKTQHDYRVAIAFLDGATDRSPVNCDLKWQGVINLLSRPDERREKDGRAFVPAEFGLREYTRKDGTTYEAVLRRAKAVEWVSMGVCDYDHGVTPKQAARLWQDYEHVIYTTHSHRKGKPRFRVVLPLAEPIPAEHWKSAWRHFRDMGRVGSQTIDLACSDASRLYYLPSHPPGVRPRSRYNPGKLLSLPTTTHRELRKNNLLTKIRANLPKPSSITTLLLPDWLLSKGVNFRPKPGDPEVCQLPECPWSAEHASGTDDWGHAVVFTQDDGRWAFSCCHTTCKERGRGWRDFREHVAPRSAPGVERFTVKLGRRPQ
jgi:hypothetical protein